MRNHLSLSKRGGTTSKRRAGQHHIFLWVACRFFTPRHAVKPPGANALQSFESTCASERGLGECAHARDVVLARASMTCIARALFVFHIHAHTTHTPHNNALSTQLFFHEISLKFSGRNIRITRTNQHLGVRYPILLLCLVLLCTFVYVRMFVSVVCFVSYHVAGL